LAQDDKRQVYEAIAFVISAMPMQQAGSALREFAVDILQQLHSLATKPTVATKQELQEVSGMTFHFVLVHKLMLSARGPGEPRSHASCHQAVWRRASHCV
jgi:transportin-3